MILIKIFMQKSSVHNLSKFERVYNYFNKLFPIFFQNFLILII